MEDGNLAWNGTSTNNSIEKGIIRKLPNCTRNARIPGEKSASSNITYSQTRKYSHRKNTMLEMDYAILRVFDIYH